MYNAERMSDEREVKYLPTWAYLVTFAITAVTMAGMVVGVAWAIAWAVQS